MKKYASAKMVVTSRIHAGLPCLGLETPVIFIANEQVVSEHGSFNVPERLGGLIELFRCLNLDENGFNTDDEVLKSISCFAKSTTFENKRDWKDFADRLDKQLSSFMSDDFVVK
ncbi:MAG: hypothetical protein IJR50_03010 [Treponema sp.]|nr:hypothetical protein [Treponema sp.]